MYPVKTSEPINHSVQYIYAPFSSSSFSSTIHVKKNPYNNYKSQFQKKINPANNSLKAFDRCQYEDFIKGHMITDFILSHFCSVTI